MSDKDLEEFGFEPIADQDLEEFGFEEQTIPEEGIGTLETIGRGSLQGLTFDYGDELLGALQATAGKVQGEGDFAELYKRYRDEQRKKMEQAAEENPVAYYGSDIAAGIIPALFTGGAGAAAAVGKTAMKQGAKAAVKPAIKAAKIGGAMGALTGSGISEADLTEGDIGGFAKDVATGGIAGATLGAATPALAKVGGKVARKTGEIAKGITRALPGAEAAELAYKAGTKGIGVSQKAILDEAEKVAAKLNDKIMKVLAKSGVDRDKAVQLADEAGKRLNAGEAFDDIINDIIEKGAIGLDMKAKTKLLNNISSFKKGFEEQMIFKDLEAKTAKQAFMENAKYGSELETITEGKKPFGDILINPEGKGNVFSMRSKYSTRGPMGEKIEYIKTIAKDVKDSPIKKIIYDLENAKPSEVKEILDYINKNLVGDMQKSPVGEEGTYRKLAVQLRKLLDESVEEFADPTGTMKGIYRGAEELGIKEAGRGTQDAIEKNIKAIAKKLSSSGNASELDKRLAFRKFREASPEFADVIDEAEFISKLNDKLGGMTEGVQTTNIKGLIGTAEGSVAKIANVVGKGATAIKPVTDATKKIANKVMNYPEDKLKVASKWLNSKENKALNAMGQQLEYALQQEDGTIRSALLWSLSQQPAFRREVDKAIESQESNYMQDLGLQQSDFTEPPSSDESVFALPPEMEEEEEDNTGRSPAGKIADAVYAELPLKEGKGDLTGAAPTGNLGVTEVARKTVGMNDEWKNAKSEEERDEIDKKVARLYLNYLENKMPDSWKKMPEGIQKGFLDAAYNIGPGIFNYTQLNKGIQNKDWAYAAKNLLDSANIDGKSSKGLAKRRAEAYNDIAQEAGFNTIGGVEQELDGTIIYYDNEGNEIFKYDPKTKMPHESSKPGKVLIDKFENVLGAHERYRNSGGSAIMSSTGDRMMGVIDETPYSEEEKDEAKQAVLDGNIPYLRDMMNRLKGLA